MATHAQNKEMETLMRRVAKLPGWRIEPRAKDGWKVFPPDGGRPFSVSGGPRSPYRQRRNVLSQLRRHGADL